MRAKAIGLALALAASTATAEARVALKDDPTIESGLQVVAIGKILSRGCGEISPRRIKALSFAMSLQSRARALGYSDAEIDAYLDSERDKERIKAQARKYLIARGANLSDTKSICAVGRSEVAQGTSVGAFLRVN